MVILYGKEQKEVKYEISTFSSNILFDNSSDFYGYWIVTSNMIKVSEKESAYTSLLYNSTYDAVRAYQINTQNNNYSSERTSKG